MKKIKWSVKKFLPSLAMNKVVIPNKKGYGIHVKRIDFQKMQVTYRYIKLPVLKRKV